MKKNCFYVLAAAAWMAVSCTTNEIPTQSISDQTITIVANVSPHSRAPQLNSDGSGSLVKGDVMTLCMAKSDADNISIDYAYQKETITWGGLNLPESTRQIKMAACYPRQVIASNGMFEFNVLTAQEKDLLLSPAQTIEVGTSNAVNLNFKHALHRLDLTFTQGNGYSADDLKNLTLSLHAKNCCIVDAFEGKIYEVASEKATYTSTGTIASFYLVPQETSGITLDVTVDDQKKTLALSDLLNQLGEPQNDLKGGAKCTITLKVGREGIIVESGTIGAWEDQVTVDGDLIIG